MITMGTIKRHLRIDGCAEDDVLAAYVAAAVEAAEAYTHTRIRPGWACDTIESPMGRAFRIRGQPSGAVVGRYSIGGQTVSVPARASGRTVTLPVTLDCGVDTLEICYQVGPPADDAGQLATAGDAAVIAVASPTIELGILKYVAHAYMHRGDSPNAWATDSGAVEMWSMNRRVIF
jgi:hypothetical protein